MAEKRAKIVMLTRYESGSCYIAKHLSELDKFQLQAIFMESRAKGRFQLMRHKIKKKWRRDGFIQTLAFIFGLPYIYFHDRKLLKMQKKALWKNSLHAMPLAVQQFNVQSLNDPAVVQKLKALDLDFIVVYGTRILDKEVFQNSKIATINLHMGITPEYRGSKGEFWAMYNNDYQHVGSTVHRVDEGIDTGDILAQSYLAVEADDNELTLRVKNIVASVGLLERVISDLLLGKQLSIGRQGRESRFYSTPSPMQYIKLHRRLRAGKKLAGKEK